MNDSSSMLYNISLKCKNQNMSNLPGQCSASQELEFIFSQTFDAAKEQVAFSGEKTPYVKNGLATG
jgi:hypothetical protein